MKKHFMAALLAIVMCFAALTGCTFVRGLEKDLQVALKFNDELYASVTVNAFNNAVVEEPFVKGMKFKGWSPKADWKEGDDEALVLPNTGLIRYDDVKDYVKGNELSVTLYGIVTEIPQHDIAIAWYNKSSTSGLDQTAMDTFKTKLYAFLTEQGYKPDDMDIVIRGYEGDVGTSCGAIMKDGDIDIMVGWAGYTNLRDTGGMTPGEDFLENVSNITIGSKARYSARKTDTEMSKLVYQWIQTEFGDGVKINYPTGGTTNPTPDPEPAFTPIPASENRLVIAWYEASASGLNATIAGEVEENLKIYLAEQGKNLSDITLVLRRYDDNVATSCAAVMSNGDVDIMIGWGGNITTNGKMEEGKDFIEHIGGLTFGEKTNRYITRITDTELVKLAANRIKEQYTPAPVEPDPDPDPDNPDPITETTLVIGWWNYKTSGLSKDIVNQVVDGIKTYLTSQGVDITKLTITIKGYEQEKVADAFVAINNDNDVDLMFGMKATSGKDSNGVTQEMVVVDDIQNVDMGTATGRRIHLLDGENQLAKLVFEWFKTDAEALKLFVAAE